MQNVITDLSLRKLQSLTTACSIKMKQEFDKIIVTCCCGKTVQRFSDIHCQYLFLQSAVLALLIPSYFGPTRYNGGGGHLDPLLSHQHLVVQTSNFARY